MQNHQSLHILGAGAIGQLIAHKLTDAGANCQLIVRDVNNFSGDTWHIKDQSTDQVFEISDYRSEQMINTLIICVKAPQLYDAIKAINHRINHDTQIVCLLNGMGHQHVFSLPEFQESIHLDKVFYASNTHGVFRESTQTIRYAGKGTIEIGSLNQQNRENLSCLSLLEASELDVQWNSNMQIVLLKKLMVNAIINPLTAIHQCKNGELLNIEKAHTQLLALINETRRFATELALPFAENLKETVLQVIEKTAENTNSMLQDVRNGNTTEINSINGYLLDLMSEHDFSAPHHWKIWSEFHIAYPPLKAQVDLSALNEIQQHVTQQHGTERPFTGKYYQHDEQGNYHCLCCRSELFSSSSKFDAHCGWPSFDRATNNKAIAYINDSSHGMSRTEILCAQCSAHLGHIFDDGPTETGLRFCVNSASLSFTP